MSATEDEQGAPPIAIVAMAGRFPGADTVEDLWNVIAEGRDTLSHFSTDQVTGDGPNFVPSRGIIHGIEDFDARFFGYNPVEAAQLDPQHRLWLEVAWETLERGGYAHGNHEQVIGVYAGSFSSNYLLHSLLPDRKAVEEFVRMGRMRSFAQLVNNDPSFMPSRTAYKLGLKGPAVNVQTACSTSLVAISVAVQSLLAYETDMAIAGGVCLAVPQVGGYYYQEGAIFSSDGVCRPYDKAGSGTVFSNGAGAVLLKRLEDAERDGDPIQAVIRGVAINNDGNDKISYTAPSVDGQAEAIMTAYAIAGIDADTIGYVEGHGTATPMGDPIEVEALRRVYEQAGAQPQSCALGSIKGNIGHLDAAAGVAGLMRATCALQHAMLPATAHFAAENPETKLSQSPFFVLKESRPWPTGAAPRRAAVSSFGIGGTNAHAVLEEYPAPTMEPRAADVPESTVLVLSAMDPDALNGQAKRLADHLDSLLLEGQAPHPLGDVAHTLAHRRRTFPRRAAFAVDSWSDAVQALRNSDRRESAVASETDVTKIAFAFPGQGALHPGMLAPVLDSQTDFADLLKPLATAASALVDFDIWGWLADPSATMEPLSTDNALTQLTVFCVDVALAQWLEKQGVHAAAYMGHSLGEWVGMHLGGVLSLPDALTAVYHRGRLMQTTGQGAAITVRLSEADARSYVNGTDDLALACINGPKACLISGGIDAIAECVARLAADKIPHRSVPIDVAVHSARMDAVVEPFRKELAKLNFKQTQIPLLSTVDGKWMSAEASADLDYWSRQMRAPVRFDDAAQTLWAKDEWTALEVGQGTALSGLLNARRANRANQRAIAILPAEPAGERALRRAIARLWANGLDLDPTSGCRAAARAPTLPTYPFQRSRHWIEPPAEAEAGASTASAPGAASTGSSASDSNDIGETLIALISELSGLASKELERDARFRDLGLDSLFLAQLAEVLSERLNQHVTFGLFSEHNTIDKMAAYLESNAPTVVAPSPSQRTRNVAGGFSGLFPLREGDGRLPLLLIHGDIANELILEYLPQEQTVYGYLHQGSDGERMQFTNVIDLAKRCLAEWESTFDDTPFVVAGHSFGGLVGYHMACLRADRGLPLTDVLLIDSPHPASYRPDLNNPRAALAFAMREVRDRATFLRGQAAAEWDLRRTGQVSLKHRTGYVVGRYELALREYRPPTLAQGLTVFRATAGHNPAHDNGWSISVHGPVEVCDVDGDHLSMVRDPEVFRPIGKHIAARMEILRSRTRPATPLNGAVRP